MSDRADKARAEFYNICGEILMGKEDKTKMEKVVQEMLVTGQSELVIKEFKEIGLKLGLFF